MVEKKKFLGGEIVDQKKEGGKASDFFDNMCKDDRLIWKESEEFFVKELCSR